MKVDLCTGGHARAPPFELRPGLFYCMYFFNVLDMSEIRFLKPFIPSTIMEFLLKVFFEDYQINSETLPLAQPPRFASRGIKRLSPVIKTRAFF